MYFPHSIHVFYHKFYVRVTGGTCKKTQINNELILGAMCCLIEFMQMRYLPPQHYGLCYHSLDHLTKNVILPKCHACQHMGLKLL